MNHTVSPSAAPSIEATAYFLEQRIDVKTIPDIATTNSRAYKATLPGGGYAYVYRYGAVIFFNTPKEEMTAFLQKYAPSSTPSASKTFEAITINISPEKDDDVFFDKINIKEATETRLLIISDILAKSVFLEYYEEKVIEIFNVLDPISNKLQLGKLPSKGDLRLYLTYIGSTYNIQRSFAGQVGINEKPDVLWDQPPEMSNFFSRLEDEYDILERYEALKEKLEIVHQTSQTMVDLDQTRQSLRVEWYIVLLIVFDIVLSLAEKLF